MLFIVYDSDGIWQPGAHEADCGGAIVGVFCERASSSRLRAGLVYLRRRYLHRGWPQCPFHRARSAGATQRRANRHSPRGHAEILLGPNAVLWTGTRAQIRFDDTRVENTVIALLTGSAVIEIKKSLESSRVEVDLGAFNIEITREGVYRFDRDTQTVRVYGGELQLPGALKLMRGEESVDGVVRAFDRKQMDDLHYWSAYRSLSLESDAGAYRNWGGDRWGQREHSGFGVKFPEGTGAARLKSQVAPEAGLLYHVDGGAILGPERQSGPIRLPLLMGRDRFLRTQNGRAEIFLGIGVTLRMGREYLASPARLARGQSRGWH